MTDQTSNKITRRDAIKILAAATGAVVLANIPDKWTKPILEGGVLPAHAQTSPPPPPPPFSIVDCGVPDTMCASANSLVTITPATSGISMRYVLTPSNPAGTIVFPTQLNGTLLTDASGVADLYIEIQFMTFNINDTFTVDWSFDDPDDGIDTCQQVITYDGAC
ncbi:MAG: twin-arginine translocation signal domain-containing protein [Chloroflexi bacterium]|nr:twin-arginine translocation signal domain-containing protein [Chloroflexota bacterium]